MVLPQFLFAPDFLGTADTSPTQFLVDLPSSSEGLRPSLSALANCDREVAGLFYAIAQTTCARFSEDGDVAVFFASMLFVESGWQACYRADAQAVTDFFYDVSSLADHSETVVQISLGMLIPSLAVDGADLDEIFLGLVLHAIGSPKPLVQYYGARGLSAILPQYRETNRWESVRELIAPLIPTVIPLTMTMARQFGISDIAQMVSVVIKDPLLLPAVLEFAGDLVSAVFDLATFASASTDQMGDITPIIAIVLNLVRELAGDPGAQNAICGHILHCAGGTLDEIGDPSWFSGYIEIFNIVTLHMPELPPETWRLIDFLATGIGPATSGRVWTPAAYLLHNLMLTDSGRTRGYLGTLFTLGSTLLHTEEFPGRVDAICAYFSGLIAVTPADSVPREMLGAICEVMNGATLIGELAMLDIGMATQLILAVLSCDAGMLELLWETVQEWTQIADNWAVACALGIAFDVWPQAEATEMLTELLQTETLASLASAEPDIDEMAFEQQLNLVGVKGRPVFPIESALDLFLARLMNIALVAPEWAAELGIDAWIAANCG
jgi:hypothetical protein